MITTKTTLADLQALATERGIKSIRLRHDIVDPALSVAELTLKEGSAIIRRGLSVADAIANAFEVLDARHAP